MSDLLSYVGVHDRCRKRQLAKYIRWRTPMRLETKPTPGDRIGLQAPPEA